MIGLVVYLVYWLGGWVFAVWMWTIEFGEDDVVPTAAFALIYCTLFGPLVGFLWWPSKDAWVRRTQRKKAIEKYGKPSKFASDEELARRWRERFPQYGGEQ